VQGHFDGLVTRRGYDQIRALRRRFDGVEIDAVYSSDLFRARTTARAVSEPRGLEIQLRRDLREVNLGWWEGLPWQHVAAMDMEQLHHFHLDLAHFDVKNGESAAVVRDRMLAALRSIAAENEGKTVAVFSHGAALRILLGTVRGMALGEIDQTVLGDNTSVTLLEVENGVIREVYGNDNSHLTEAGLTRFVARKKNQSVTRFEDGIGYHPVSDDDRQTLRGRGCDVPQEGELIGVYWGAELAGAVQLAGCDGETGVVGYYCMQPEFRGQRNKSIQPLGQAVMRYRAEGCTRLRLPFVPEEYRRYFARYGFEETNNGAMEMSIGYEDREI
jgi:probable phosphoglycerate mutase